MNSNTYNKKFVHLSFTSVLNLDFQICRILCKIIVLAKLH